MDGAVVGYLLLPIYSAVNLCDRSWGTREQHNGEDEGLWGWRKYPIMLWKKFSSCFLSKCLRLKPAAEEEKLIEEDTAGRDSALHTRSLAESDTISVDISLNLEDPKEYYYYYQDSPQMDEDALRWLRQHKSEVRFVFACNPCIVVILITIIMVRGP